MHTFPRHDPPHPVAGSYRISVLATDAAGNRSAVQRATLKIVKK